MKLRFTNRKMPIAQVLQSISNKCQIPYCKQFKPFLITSCLGRPFFNPLSLPCFFREMSEFLKSTMQFDEKTIKCSFFFGKLQLFFNILIFSFVDIF